MLENLLNYNIKLASGSPRRRELLAMLGIRFEVVRGHDVDEAWPASLFPGDVAPYLATLKANAYRPDLGANDLIITADTVVICGDTILGKPASHAEACAMLRMLSGRTHHVITAVCLLTKEFTETFAASTAVTFAPLTDHEIDWYVSQFKPFDKAGAYGIQEAIGAVAVSRIDGSFYNVMGLPVHQLYDRLKRILPPQ